MIGRRLNPTHAKNKSWTFTKILSVTDYLSGVVSRGLWSEQKVWSTCLSFSRCLCSCVDRHGSSTGFSGTIPSSRYLVLQSSISVYLSCSKPVHIELENYCVCRYQMALGARLEHCSWSCTRYTGKTRGMGALTLRMGIRSRWMRWSLWKTTSKMTSKCRWCCVWMISNIFCSFYFLSGFFSWSLVSSFLAAVNEESLVAGSSQQAWIWNGTKRSQTRCNCKIRFGWMPESHCVSQTFNLNFLPCCLISLDFLFLRLNRPKCRYYTYMYREWSKLVEIDEFSFNTTKL